MTLFFDHAGPLMRWRNNMLEIADLNPEKIMRWRFSRWELFKLGLRCLRVACFSRQPPAPVPIDGPALKDDELKTLRDR